MKDFKKLSEEEVKNLTEEQKGEYIANLIKHNNDEIVESQKQIEDLKKQLEEKSDDEIEAKLKKLTDESNASLKAMVEAQGALLSKMKKENEATPSNVKEETDFMKFLMRENKSLSEWEKYGVKAAALMTTANVVPNVADGFNQLFGNYIDGEIHSAPKRDPFMLELVDTQVAPGTENIWYVQRINEEGDAEFIAEGSLKPLIDGEYKEFKADVKEVAARWKVSKRLLKHAPSVISDFREHADELMQLKIDEGVLTGDGLGDNLSGVATLASPFIVPTQLAGFYQDANIFDAIMAVATYVRLNNFKGNLTCVLNTVWKAKFFGYKETTTGSYILPSFVTPDGKRVGEVEVQFRNGVDEDKILLGELKRFKVRISENVEYAEGLEHDDFSKNLESRRLDAYLGTYLPSNYAGAIIYDDIATVLVAITST